MVRQYEFKLGSFLLSVPTGRSVSFASVNGYQRTISRIDMHVYSSRRAQWIAYANRPEFAHDSDRTLQARVICAAHFEPIAFTGPKRNRLKKDARPSVRVTNVRLKQLVPAGKITKNICFFFFWLRLKLTFFIILLSQSTSKMFTAHIQVGLIF